MPDETQPKPQESVIKQFLRYTRHIPEEELNELFTQGEWEVFLESSDSEYGNIAVGIPSNGVIYAGIIRTFQNHSTPGRTLLQLGIILGDNQPSGDLTEKLKKLGFVNEGNSVYQDIMYRFQNK